MTPLCLAIENRNVDIVKILLSSDKINPSINKIMLNLFLYNSIILYLNSILKSYFSIAFQIMHFLDALIQVFHAIFYQIFNRY